MNNKEMADILDKAHDEMLVRGRTKGSGVNYKGEVCIIGAIACAMGINPLDWGTVAYLNPGIMQALAKRVPRNIPPHYPLGNPHTSEGVVYRFNDAIDTTDDECFDWLRNTAKELREIDCQTP